MNESIAALHFDGRQAQARRVHLHVEQDELVVQGESTQRWPLRDVQWPERTRHGRRVAHLRGGGSLEFADASEFDAWRRSHGAHESWVVRSQQHWGAVLAVVTLLVALLLATWVWGIPAAARGVVALVPTKVDQTVGELAYRSMAERWLAPSALPEQRQQQLRSELEQAVAKAWPGQPAPPWSLSFAAASKELGPNAFALPGGRIVVTDAMVELLQGRDDALLGVLGHEFGHVRQRHGMRALVQATLIGAVASVAIGDFSTLLAGAPVVLANMGYSRNFERAADAESVTVMRAAGISPTAMLAFFERLQPLREASGGAGILPIALASHPADEERVQFFREAARQRDETR